ncbi:hypothetical protein ABIB82_000135 [Bradyrhizobium sp. i1.8.4]
MISSLHLSTILNRPPQTPIQQKGRDCSRPLQFADGVGWYALPPYFASARLGGLAGHDLISVS